MPETKDEAEDDEKVSSKAEATTRKKRSIFNTAMFSMSKRKTAPQVPMNNYEIEGSTRSTSAKEREVVVEEDVSRKSVGSGGDLVAPSLPLPSLTSWMGLTEAFEEAEPGEFVYAYLCVSPSLGKPDCVLHTHTHMCSLSASQQVWRA